MTEFGKITDVHIDTDNEIIRVDVALSIRRHAERIPFRTPHRDMWLVPEVGDMVEVASVGDGKRVALAPHTQKSGMPSGLAEGDIVIQLASGTFLEMKKSSGDVTLNCDGDLNLDAANIFVGDSANSKKLATEDHVHTESGGGTTGKPDDTTEHEVE